MPPSHPEILVVIVRYQTPLAESQTLRGLQTALLAHPDLASALQLLLWDNSPTPLPESDLAITTLPVLYQHSPSNSGVSGAYNAAIPIARARLLPWMLLLDQDTSVTAPFLLAMLDLARALLPQTRIAAISPTVKVGALVVSPRQTTFNGNRVYTGPSGIAPGDPFAINSGCLMRISALDQIGGFSPDFWLDYSDMYVFHQFHLHNLQVWRAAEIELHHEMSIMDYDKLMTPWRYQNFIAAEGAFIDLYKPPLERAVQNLRLLVRALLQRRRYRNPAFSRMTLVHLAFRLRHRRPTRLRLWHATQQQRRLASSVTPNQSEPHP